MTEKLVALKVKIGLRPNGHADHPAFDRLPLFINKPPGAWDRYIIDCCGGWKYDSVSGHAEHDDESPQGQQFGVLFVGRDFAHQAVTMFPDICEVVDEAEATRFYEQRHQAKTQRLNRNPEVLNGIKLEIELQRELLAAAKPQDKIKFQRRLDAAIADAEAITDASNSVAGVRANRKTFVEFKADLDMEIV